MPLVEAFFPKKISISISSKIFIALRKELKISINEIPTQIFHQLQE